MPGEFYFMALGGLGVSLAGFAGLIAAFDRRPNAHSAIAAWRLRNIVIGGFFVTFAGFGTVALHTATDDNLQLTVRLVSLGLVLYDLALLGLEHRAGPAWPNERRRRRQVLGVAVFVIVAAANVAFGGLGVLQILLLIHLFYPMSIFVNTVVDVTRDADANSGSGRDAPPDT